MFSRILNKMGHTLLNMLDAGLHQDMNCTKRGVHQIISTSVIDQQLWICGPSVDHFNNNEYRALLHSYVRRLLLAFSLCDIKRVTL